jgi:hypothetical protein
MRWSPRRFATAAFAAAVLGAVVAAFAPLGRACSSSSAGQERCVDTSLFQTEGTWILVVVSVPLLLTFVPAVWPRRGVRIVAAVLLWAACFVAVFSVGVFFVPAAVLETVAAARREVLAPA